jgi:hypothetical protein
MKNTIRMLALALGLALGGCSSSFHLSVTPIPKLDAHAPTKGVVQLISLTDQRPRDNSSTQPPCFYVKAGGVTDIFTYPVNVEEIVFDVLKEGFARDGYDLQRSPGSGSVPAATAAVAIKSYRGFNESAAGGLTVLAEVQFECTLTINGTEKRFAASGRGQNHTANLFRSGNINIHKAMQLAYDDFLTNFVTELKKAGL